MIKPSHLILALVVGFYFGQQASFRAMRSHAVQSLTLEFSRALARGYALALAEEPARERNAIDKQNLFELDFEADI